MFRILVSDEIGETGLLLLDAATDVAFDVQIDLSRDELLAAVPAYDGLIVRSGTRVDAALLDAADRLKVVVRAGTGVDNIDIEAATARGIIVMNTPEANSVAAAELTMALILAASRHVVPAHQALAHGQWRRRTFVGTELRGKTLGIVGLGRIGRLVARRARAFEMQVIAYDPFVLEEDALAQEVILYDLDELLAQADVVTLHTAVTPETIGIIDADAIAQMKEDAVLINVARGRLVDEEALLAALDSGRLRAAALDVYAHEPPDGNNALIGHPRILHTPHLGDSTTEAQHAVATQAVTGILDALRGINFPNAINLPFPAALDYSHVRPYMLLAEKLGQLQSHMAPAPITHVDVDVRGETVNGLLRPIATALLKGLLRVMGEPAVNDVNAPLRAEARGIGLGQGMGLEVADYPNLISCRARWEGGERIISGVLFGGDQPRVVQVDNYHLDANPAGVVLIMQNRDVPGVIGQIGTILAAYDVNIGEWRMGRYAPGSEALSFINLDSDPPPEVLAALGKVKPVTFVTVVRL